jgi:hypothetical protein
VTLKSALPAERSGRAVLATAACAFVAIAVPLVCRGAPLADDFNNCIAPQQLGLAGFLSSSWQQLGAIRPARFLEILITAGVCRSLPFGVAIVVSVLLTLAVAWLVREMLCDVGIPAHWANVGGALWLLQPLGTEAGMWPATLHVPLGLAAALTALRLYRRGRIYLAAAANVIAVLSIEQVILPLPLAAWALTPAGGRRRAAMTSGIIGVIAMTAFVLWPGRNPRLHVTFAERLHGLVADPTFYAGFPAVGLGVHSIPLAVLWGWPWSPMLLLLGGAAGWLIVPKLAAATAPAASGVLRRAVFTVSAVILLTNVVVVLAVPQQGSPRVFTPTWLVLSTAAAAGAASVRWRGPRVVGAIAGVLAAGAVLSLAFSVAIRLRSADFTERAAALVAARVREGGTVAVCDVRRTVVEPAPRGAFAVHDFIYDWAAERAVTYYTGRHATIRLAGQLWNIPCPSPPTVDTVIDFDELLAPTSR